MSEGDGAQGPTDAAHAPNAGGRAEVDLRAINRIPVRLRVSQQGRSAPLGQTRDLSLNGVFIETDEPFALGTVLPLAISLDKTTHVSVQAEVVRLTDHGMGLRFEAIDGEGVKTLRRWFNESLSVEGRRKQAEELQEPSRSVQPIVDPARVREVVEQMRRDKVDVVLIPCERRARATGRVVRSGDGEVVLQAERGHALQTGEEVFGLLTLGYDSYAFTTTVLSIQERFVHLRMPPQISFSERRLVDRRAMPPGSLLRWPVAWDDGAVELPLLERSAEGLSFRAPAEGALLTVGSAIIGATLLVDGKVEAMPRGEIRNIRLIADPNGSWLRVGVALGRQRGARAVTRTERKHKQTPIGRLVAKVRDVFSVMFHRGKHRFKAGDLEARKVTVRAGALPIVGLLDRTVDSEERMSAPLFIIVPAFAGRKEQMAVLAGTLIEGFQRQNADIAVLRIDGTNNLGESGKDPECAKDSLHTLHFTLGGVVEDVRAALKWAKNNPYVDPTNIVLMSISIASVGIRHLLAQPEGADVGLWVSYMGAPEAVESIRNFSGHVDLDAPFRDGHALGVVSLGGSLVDADRFFADLHAQKIAYFDVARAEIAKVRSDVVWVCGSADAYIDPRRVEELMAVPAPGRREITVVEGGHIPRTGGEAIRQFVDITERVWALTHGGEIGGFWPSVGRLAVKSESEWKAVRRKGIQDRAEWWKRYLLDNEGGGFDLLELAPEYTELMNLTAERCAAEGVKTVLELGAGTGNLTRRLLERGLRVMASDIVPEAVEVLRAKCRGYEDRLETRVLDLEGRPLVALRRFGAGDLLDPHTLSERVPGVARPTLEEILQHQGEDLIAILRGFEVDFEGLTRRWRLTSKARALLGDLHLAARVASGRLTRAEAVAKLGALSPEVLEPAGLDQPSGSVDAVAMSLVLSYLAEPDDLLFEIHRVLKPGGRLVLSSLVRDAESSRLFLGIVARLETCSDDELPHWVGAREGVDRDAHRRQLISATRRFADQGGELLRLEEEGLFKFFDGPELALRVARRGFVDIQVDSSFGNPPQAVIVTCRKP